MKKIVILLVCLVVALIAVSIANAEYITDVDTNTCYEMVDCEPFESTEDFEEVIFITDPEILSIDEIVENEVFDESLVEEVVPWVDTWADDAKPTAQIIWDTYVGDPSLLDEDAYWQLDSLVFEALGEYGNF